MTVLRQFLRGSFPKPANGKHNKRAFPIYTQQKLFRLAGFSSPFLKTRNAVISILLLSYLNKNVPTYMNNMTSVFPRRVASTIVTSHYDLEATFSKSQRLNGKIFELWVVISAAQRLPIEYGYCSRSFAGPLRD